jgi:hypothetical protein
MEIKKGTLVLAFEANIDANVHVRHPPWNSVEVDVKTLVVRLDDRGVDLDQPVKIQQGGRTLYHGLVPRTWATMAQTLAGYGDPRLIFDAQVLVELRPSAR